MLSIGILASCPNIRTNSVNPVVNCSLVLYTIQVGALPSHGGDPEWLFTMNDQCLIESLHHAIALRMIACSPGFLDSKDLSHLSSKENCHPCNRLHWALYPTVLQRCSALGSGLLSFGTVLTGLTPQFIICVKSGPINLSHSLFRVLPFPKWPDMAPPCKSLSTGSLWLRGTTSWV